jgi:hypothetical protein
MTHTAGFPDEYWDQYPGKTRREFIYGVMQKPLVAKPGTEWHYASFDYWLIEEIIERVSGMPFEAFLRKELWEPNGMLHTGFSLPKWDSVARYTLWTIPSAALSGGGQFADPLTRPPEWRIMLSTADDLHRWWLALRAGRVLSAASRAKLFTPVKQDYAYGWYVMTTNRATKLIHHGGGGGGLGSVVTFRWFVDEDTFVTILNNSFNPSFQTDYVMEDVEHLLFGGSGSLPPPAIERIDAETRDVGTYRLPSGGMIEVIKSSHGPLVARSRNADAIIALRFGGMEEEHALPADTAAIAQLKDAGAKTMLYRIFFYNRVPEIHGYLSTSAGKIVRAIHNPSGEIHFDGPQVLPGIEAVLAPSPEGGYTTWDFRLGASVRITFDASHRMHLHGAQGEVIALQQPVQKN